MNAVEQNFRRNLAIACIVHVVLIGGMVFYEAFLSHANRSKPAFVTLITPADILGDLPKGLGRGRGDYTPPSDPPQASLGPSESALAADEHPAPQPRPAVRPANDPGEIRILRKPSVVKQKKPVQTPASSAVSKSVKTASISKTAPAAVSADEFRRRFSKALQTSGGGQGSAGGDNKPAGGGTGESKYGRLGSPDGAVDGIPGGIGKGSPFWSYYLHVHDRMYEAWEQPGQALNWDKRLMTTVMIRVARDGKIVNVELGDSSGNKLMDDSALAAARRVQRLDPLPDGLGGATADISVSFQLEG
jgi:TonB family protein